MSMFAKICYIKTCPFILWREIWVSSCAERPRLKLILLLILLIEKILYTDD